MSETTTTTPMIDQITRLASQTADTMAYRAAWMLLDAIRDYHSQSQRAVEYAGYVKDAMDRVIKHVEDGQRVFNSDVVSWQNNLAEAVAARQAAADRIRELTWVLVLDEDDPDALWAEIEAGVQP